jgi:polar amino acid transport system substrate-binding protein
MRISLLLWFFIWVTAPLAQAQTRVITLCYDETTVRPWVNKAGAPILKTAAGMQRLEIEQLGLPWLRCLRDVSKGLVSGAIGASYTDERSMFAVYPSTADGQLDVSRRMQSSSYSLFRVKGLNTGWDGKQFSNLSSRVVAQRGYSVVGDLTKLGVLVDQTASEPETVFKMLIAGRAQLGALVTEQGDETMAKPEFRKQIEKLSPPLVVKDYYLIFGKRYYEDNHRLVEELWNHVAVVRDAKGTTSR